MPLYEFRCDACEKVHEVMQKFSDPPLEVCPDCNGKVYKQVSLSSFALKGTGWYASDYKKAQPKPAESKSTPVNSGGSEAASKQESKGDSKSEAKFEKKAESQPQATSAKAESKPASTP